MTCLIMKLVPKLPRHKSKYMVFQTSRKLDWMQSKLGFKSTLQYRMPAWKIMYLYSCLFAWNIMVEDCLSTWAMATFVVDEYYLNHQHEELRITEVSCPQRTTEQLRLQRIWEWRILEWTMECIKLVHQTNKIKSEKKVSNFLDLETSVPMWHVSDCLRFGVRGR